MKKILSILGTITIAGSGIAGLVGNAPAPAKNEINHLQINNLEQLNRTKRQWGPGWNGGGGTYSETGQIKLDINQIFTSNHLSVPLPLGYGRNNPPSNSSIIDSLIRQNPNAGSKPELYSALNVVWATRSEAYIQASPNTPFIGSIMVRY